MLPSPTDIVAAFTQRPNCFLYNVGIVASEIPVGFLAVALLNNASHLKALLNIRQRAALPELNSGLRAAVGTAPIGAIVGKWIGVPAGPTSGV